MLLDIAPLARDLPGSVLTDSVWLGLGLVALLLVVAVAFLRRKRASGHDRTDGN